MSVTDQATPDKLDLNIVLSPLADPVVSAIFANLEVAGEAAGSLVRAVLESDKSILRGKIINVTPQKVHTSPKFRGCRIS